jgi:Zn-finger nucleic acid-binding protein
MPVSLNCPNCGAPAPAGADATQCDYCGSRLTSVACPSCFGSMFVGSQFCPHCGAKAAAAEKGDAAPMPCPGCRGDMPLVTVGSVETHQCEKCGSVWLAPDVFANLCANQEVRGMFADTLGAQFANPEKKNAAGPVRYVRCATCDKVMNRVNFGKTSGIVVDVCKSHGVWFEADELRRVLDFVANGGLEQLRRNEAERKALQEQALGMQQQQAFHQFVQYGGAVPNTSGLSIRFSVTTSSKHVEGSLANDILKALFG